MLPKNIVLIRHGESEGNVIDHLYRDGKAVNLSDGFYHKHCSLWRLTPQGVRQAQVTGDWVRDNLEHIFKNNCAFYVSPFIRTKETAGHLAIPDARWVKTNLLRDRDWGDVDKGDKDGRYPSVDLKDEDMSIFWFRPQNGETMPETCHRIEEFLETLHPDENVIIVTHGEILLAFRTVIEQLDDAQYHKLVTTSSERVHNCQVMIFSRENPHAKDDYLPAIQTMRSLCPQKCDSVDKTIKVESKKCSNEELLREAEAIKRDSVSDM
jgi:broad specificity phosphatase PhoE